MSDSMFPSIDALSPEPSSQPPAADSGERLYSLAEAEELAARRVAADRQRRQRQAPAAPAAPMDPMAAIGSLVQLQIAQALGALRPPQPQNAIPVTDRGSPPVPSLPLTERSILQMTPDERERLANEKGNAFYTQKLMREMRNVRVRMS